MEVALILSIIGLVLAIVGIILGIVALVKKQDKLSDDEVKFLETNTTKKSGSGTTNTFRRY